MPWCRRIFPRRCPAAMPVEEESCACAPCSSLQMRRWVLPDRRRRRRKLYLFLNCGGGALIRYDAVTVLAMVITMLDEGEEVVVPHAVRRMSARGHALHTGETAAVLRPDNVVIN